MPRCIFEGFEKKDMPADPTGARPLVVTPKGIERKATGARAEPKETPAVREERRSRPLIYVGGAIVLALIALIIVLIASGEDFDSPAYY